MKSKGISPIIAAVLLMAFTLSVAIMAGPFFSNTLKKAQDGQKQQAEKLSKAANSDLSIEQVTFNRDTGRYNVSVRNSGSADITNITATIYGDKSYQKRISQTLESGKIYSLSIDTDSSEVSERLEVEADNMPVKDEEDLENALTGASPSSPSSLSLSS